jgi:hypothetical protein
MNSLELRLLDLLQLAETPLYSAYRWLGERVGAQLSLPEFLRLVDQMASGDTVRLWSVDPGTSTRKRLPRVPDHLERRYDELGDLDGTYDPLGLSVTVGPRSAPREEPAWSIDLDIAAQRFVLTGDADVVDEAEEAVNRLFPDLELVERERRTDHGRVRIVGSVQPASRS